MIRFLILAAILSVALSGCATSDRKAGVALISPPALKSKSLSKAFGDPLVRGVTLEWTECKAPGVPVFYEVFDRQSLDDPWAYYASTTNLFLRIEPLYQGLHVFAVRGAWVYDGATNYTPFAAGPCPE